MSPTPPTDEELNAYILTRFALLGIDISVLPEDDDDAVMDQASVLSNARSILRDEVEIADVPMDAQLHAPALYPAAMWAWTMEEER